MPRGSNKLSGVLTINKPAGITSHDVVLQIRRLLAQQEQPPFAEATGGGNLRLPKIGHAGTLDPFATGILLVLIGSTTRLMEYTHILPKTYEAEVMLGATSDTDDITGNIEECKTTAHIPITEIKKAIQKFTGTMQQIPPAYAALKIRGKKLYEYAREKTIVERKPRTITIHDIQLTSYAYPILHLAVACGAGTYIRALARDIGQALGACAYLAALRRTAIGPFTIKDAFSLDTLTRENLVSNTQPPAVLVQQLPTHTVTEEEVRKMSYGQACATQQQLAPNTPITLFDHQGELVGIGRFDAARSILVPEKLLALH